MRNIVNHPIFVRLSVRNRAPRDAGVATVRRVRFDDINVSGANGRYACGVVGVEVGIIRDVTFSGVHVSSEGGGTAADAALEPPERRHSSLEPSFMKTFRSEEWTSTRLKYSHYCTSLQPSSAS